MVFKFGLEVGVGLRVKHERLSAKGTGLRV